MRRRIDRTAERHPWLVVDVDGTIAGYAYAGPHRKREAYQWAVETSVYVHEDFRRSGLARGLYTSLFEVLGLQRFVTAYAGIVLPNEASVAFHRSMGFDPFCTYETVGHKHGAWRDVQWYQRRLGELPAEPAPPAPITEVRSRESWDEAVSVGRSSIEL